MIRVLPDNHDLQIVRIALIERPENIFPGGKNLPRGIFLFDERGKLLEIGFLKLRSDQIFPPRSYLYVHIAINLG